MGAMHTVWLVSNNVRCVNWMSMEGRNKKRKGQYKFKLTGKSAHNFRLLCQFGPTGMLEVFVKSEIKIGIYKRVQSTNIPVDKFLSQVWSVKFCFIGLLSGWGYNSQLIRKLSISRAFPMYTAMLAMIPLSKSTNASFNVLGLAKLR